MLQFKRSNTCSQIKLQPTRTEYQEVNKDRKPRTVQRKGEYCLPVNNILGMKVVDTLEQTIK